MRCPTHRLSAGPCLDGIACATIHGVQPGDLTLKILQEMRDELRSSNGRLDAMAREQSQRFEAMAREQSQRFEAMAREHAERFEVIETALRDLAQQLVIIGRAVKVAMDDRRASTEQWHDLERRVTDLERKVG